MLNLICAATIFNKSISQKINYNDDSYILHITMMVVIDKGTGVKLWSFAQVIASYCCLVRCIHYHSQVIKYYSA